MNKKIMSLFVVGIFLLATFGSVSACNGGCPVVSNEKKEGRDLPKETNIKEIKNLTKEEIPMENFGEIIKLAEEKGYKILYDDAKETIFKNGVRIISIPTDDRYATILKFYYMEREKKFLPYHMNRERILPLMPLYVEKEKTTPAMFIETFLDKENLVAKSTIYYFEEQKLNKITSIVDGKKNTITLNKNGEITTQKLDNVIPTGWGCELACHIACALALSVGAGVCCAYFPPACGACIDAAETGHITICLIGCAEWCD